MNPSNIRRTKKKYVCPNPLFVKWLTEWKKEAAEKGLKTQYTYAKALASLKQYPLPLSSGKEAKILEYFGDKICAMLDAKLLEWKQGEYGSSSSSQSSTGSSSLQSSVASSSKTSSGSSSPRKIKLSSNNCGKEGSSSSPKKIKLSSNNSGKGSASSSNNSEKGIALKTVNLGRVTAIPKVPVIDNERETESTTPNISPRFHLFPGSFSIILCVDNCETYSGQGRNKKMFLTELQKSGVSFDVRKLHVGDFLWVAQENHGAQRELVLDFIVERKRMDDLARSIKDGRFREQKFRMKSCGLKHPIYLVEQCKASSYLGLPLSSCEQAIVNTQVIDGFMIKYTSNVKESASYLSTMTDMLRKKFQNSTLMAASKDDIQNKKKSPNTFMTFTEFNTSSMKNKSLTVREMFAKHLLQFFGLSVDRAAAIVDKFETPAKLLEAYDSCENEAEKEKLVSSIKYGTHKKNIGPAISRSLYQFYCAQHPPE